MSADLITEPQARQLVTADAFIVRESRGVGDYILWLVFLAGAIAALSYPFWRVYLLPEADLPSGMAVFAGLFCWLFAALMGGELKAVRQSHNWLLMLTVNQLNIHFRSFRHWKWPVDDKTVLRLSPHDVEYIQPRESLIVAEARGANPLWKTEPMRKRVGLLEIFLRDALTQDQIDVILSENVRMPTSKGIRSRSSHKPLRVSADGFVLSLDFSGRTSPNFMQTVTKLGERYRIRPIGEVEAAAPMLDSKPELTPERVRTIESLAASGDKIGAIQMLRQYTSLSLKESKDVIENGVERTLGSRIRRS